MALVRKDTSCAASIETRRLGHSRREVDEGEVLLQRVAFLQDEIRSGFVVLGLVVAGIDVANDWKPWWSSLWLDHEEFPHRQSMRVFESHV